MSYCWFKQELGKCVETVSFSYVKSYKSDHTNITPRQKQNKCMIIRIVKYILWCKRSVLYQNRTRVVVQIVVQNMKLGLEFVMLGMT